MEAASKIEGVLERKTNSFKNFDITEVDLSQVSHEKKVEIISSFEGKWIGVFDKGSFCFGQMHTNQKRGGYRGEVSKIEYELYPHGGPKDNSDRPHYMDYRNALAVIILNKK